MVRQSKNLEEKQAEMRLRIADSRSHLPRRRRIPQSFLARRYYRINPQTTRADLAMFFNLSAATAGRIIKEENAR